MTNSRNPRRNRDLGIVESAIGPAHLRMVFHGFAPTDALDEKVRFIDDQINTVSKAFLGLTISCARCHDHKFDAISQADYYAMFGVFSACRPGRTVIDLPERRQRHVPRLVALKAKIQDALARDWLAAASAIKTYLPARKAAALGADKVPSISDLYGEVRRMAADPQVHVSDAWERLKRDWRDTWHTMGAGPPASGALHVWDFGQSASYQEWHATGDGLPVESSPPGQFALTDNATAIVRGVYPAGVYSHLLTPTDAARLTSPDFTVPAPCELWLKVLGEGNAATRYVVQDYPRDGTVFPVRRLQDANWQWQRYDLSYWSGDRVHIEISTARDAPLLVREDDASWFGIAAARVVPKGATPPRVAPQYLAPLLSDAPPVQRLGDVAAWIQAQVTTAIRAWRVGQATDEQAHLLDACLREGLLPNATGQLPATRPLWQAFVETRALLPVPTRVPGLEDTPGQDQPIFIRGNHHDPGEAVPRRFLEAIDGRPFDAPGSGRWEFAQRVVHDSNPFTRRVLANRVWHHLFGQGIVRTPDNFGHMGDQPSHPELLDWLALELQRGQWSLKALVRRIVTSETWQLSSRPTREAALNDPENRGVSHAFVRRLEAEAIRDALLSVAGSLEHQLGGPSVSSDVPRRGLYLSVVRNALNPFLRAFDFPEPFTTVGRRSVTNVPAQSLMLLNSPQVAKWAEEWARRVVGDPALDSDVARLEEMYLSAFGRAPSADELRRSRIYLEQSRRALREQANQVTRLLQARDTARAGREALLVPIRQALGQRPFESAPAGLPQPWARWNFTTRPSQHPAAKIILDGRTVGEGARRTDEGLVLTQGGYWVSEPIPHTLSQKTLEVWLQLSDLEQRGGGAITLQSIDGSRFDALVYGEKEAHHWLAGSNHFARTRPFGGGAETAAEKHPIHLAITYGPDGRIAGYREGIPYGDAYVAEELLTYRQGQAVVTLGVRHLPPTGNRSLACRIFAAQVYDRALTAEEIAASASAGGNPVTFARLRRAMDAETLAALESYDATIARLESELSRMGEPSRRDSPEAAWAELARGFFLFQEFVYVR